jgi:hypothetical protein
MGRKAGNGEKQRLTKKKKSRPKAWENKAQANGLGFEDGIDYNPFVFLSPEGASQKNVCGALPKGPLRGFRASEQKI